MFRNFGIVAHVDAGKTTLAERILHVCGRIHKPGQIRGDRPTQLDHRKVEIDRGITVTAAATTVTWQDQQLSLVDTPGHIDFGVEVERALRVLDGAVLVVDAVAGVQTQTRSVERQMARYGVPRIAVINKCDHPAADAHLAACSLRRRMSLHAALLQLPLGAPGEFSGVIDLVERCVLTFSADGLVVTSAPVPPERVAEVTAAREALVDAVSLVDSELTDQVLDNGEPDADTLKAAIRRATLSRSFVPVLVAAAARGIGVQPVLDAIVSYLPAPFERSVLATEPSGGEDRVLSREGPLVAYVFKTEDTDRRVWTWLRVYRGQLEPGMAVVDGRTGREHRIGRLGRLHGGTIENLDRAGSGEIVACFGLDLPSGTTLCDPEQPLVIGALTVPEPVVERTISLLEGEESALSKGLARLVRDDPSLRFRVDAETGETLLSGQGELHLEVAADRLACEHHVRVRLGTPTVAVRYALKRASSFEYTLSKQTGGPGQYARLVGEVRPAEGFSLQWQIVGGSVSSEYHNAIERGFREEAASGAGLDWPLFGVEVIVTDGKMHDVDSSDRAFEICARAALRQVVAQVGVVRMEPVMHVVAESPDARPGTLASLLLSREGRLLDATVTGGLARVEAIVPLACMFGFSAALRSATAGAGTFAMEFQGHAPRV
jgi:elongation factor G